MHLMPYPFWFHLCNGISTGTDLWTAQPTCLFCGETGTFDGWRLTRHQSMGRYQYLYGVLPVGPHRDLTHRLFDDSRRDCDACRGTGLITLSETSWAGCGRCEGTGGFWTIDQARVQEIRREILEAFPQAVAPPDLRFLTGILVQDAETGRMIDVTCELPPGGFLADATLCPELLEWPGVRIGQSRGSRGPEQG
jgi:hypothetical protein